MEYCVAIRTLGKAGEKFQRELDSIKSQTIPPKKVFVYIPESYPIPSETAEIEDYIITSKGMVRQRVNDYSEIDTPLCLFLDDDVYLPPDAAETMIEVMRQSNADCVAADTFKNQDLPFFNKLLAFITSWAIPMRSEKWAFKVGNACSFYYNSNPTRNYYLSQSAAGPCSLWTIKAFKNIHLEDELWMDKWGFAYGDDFVTFQKLVRNGLKLVVLYNSGIEHLDAKTSSNLYLQDSQRFYTRSLMRWLVWKRVQFDPCDLSIIDRTISLLFMTLKIIWDAFLALGMSIMRLSFSPIYMYIKGIIKGISFSTSDEFKSLPSFIISKR